VFRDVLTILESKVPMIFNTIVVTVILQPYTIKQARKELKLYVTMMFILHVFWWG